MSELLPDIHRMEERQQVLWVLVATKADPHFDALSAAQISDFLANKCEIAMSRQKVIAILEKERAAGSVVMTQRKRLAHFKIMRRGEDEILSASTNAILIDPSKALTSIRAVEEILRSLQGSIRICDTYMDSKTLDYVAEMKKATGVQLLTENVQDSSRLKEISQLLLRNILFQLN
jgi:hypothetical protein